MTRTIRLATRQALLEQRSFWRSAEYALFTFAFPLMILLLIGAANAGSHLPGTTSRGPPSSSRASWPSA